MSRTISPAAWLFAAACLLATAGLVAPDVSAADRYSRGVQERVKPVPAPRVQPTPRLAPDLRTPRGSGTGASSDFYSRMGSSSACRSRCGSSCQTIACSGLNTSQCLSIRQQCRLSCNSRC
ncbi:hypothetical protein [uncultured Hyphomicrobium sp.]|uniref:hypothetical protein n=1 Tax=uncultured Hyphomicrobium sp. TaxID=194373 RepID=UPI002600F19B|nr:hypothetical protein [uncultured Hyphomicrobium sp.]